MSSMYLPVKSNMAWTCEIKQDNLESARKMDAQWTQTICKVAAIQCVGLEDYKNNFRSPWSATDALEQRNIQFFFLAPLNK